MGDFRARLGWLAIPPFLLLLALAGMAVSTEPKEEFEERTQAESQQNEQANGDQDFSDDLSDNSGNRDQNQDQSSGSQTESPDQSQDGQSADGATGSGRAADGSRRPITIRTDGGEIIIELDDNGRPSRAVAGESVVTNSERTFVPDPDGGFVGFRVTEAGRLEPVESDDFSNDDYWLRTEPGGIEIIRPDGVQVRLQTSPEGRLSGWHTSLDGVVNEVPDDNGAIVVQSAADFVPPIEVDPTTEPIAITIESETIVIELQPDGDLSAAQGADPATADFDDLSAIRVDENGDFEIVPIDEIGPEDTVLVPTGNGFDLVRPDGSRVEFRPDGENDGITATEVSATGERRELEPNPDGSVTLDDGRTVGPIDFAEDGGALERLLDQTSDLPWPWVFGAIALLAVLSIGTAVYLHRNRPDNAFDFDQFAVAGVPEDRFEKFLSVLANEPDPTRAIRLAFYAVERGMAGLPMRRADETPFEWHGRVASVQPELAKPLAPICDLFAMARFAPGDATIADRDLMIEHLRELNTVAHRASGSPAMAGV